MKTPPRFNALTLPSLCLLGALGGHPSLLNAAGPALQAPSAGVWQSVSNRKLDNLRGGFDLGRGMMVSFGISRAVYINGSLVTHTTLNLGNLSGLTPAQTAQLPSQILALRLVQNGPGNSVQSGTVGTGLSTVIQNSLDNQQIINQTVINASSNSLGIIKNMNLQTTINEAVNRAIGGR